jgi:RimJ/RimL family protein N-acetyltransferase
MGRPQIITLRRTQPEDVPLLYAIGIDEASNLLAGTKPRTWDEFQTRWTAILSDHDGSATRVLPRVILADGVFVGSINIFPQDGLDSLGYWISREHWGRGIASEAVALLLDEYSLRPLYATTAGHNQPSMRVLEKNGFKVFSRRMTPETDRAQARETVVFVLHEAR